MINPETASEYQGDPLTSPRRNDGEEDDKTVPQLLSESGQTGIGSGTHILSPEKEYRCGLPTSLKRNDGEGGDKTVPQLVSESGQTGISSGMRKLSKVAKRKEAGRQRYYANREAILVAARCRYAAKKQAKLLSQKNDELSEFLQSSETEYQNDMLM